MMQLNGHHEAQMKAHAVEAYPFECCGFLIGTQSGDQAVVMEVLRADNTHDGEKRRRFLIDPLEFIRAERIAERQELSVIGVYHSHPDHPAVPSAEDLKHAVAGLHYPIIPVKAGRSGSIRNWTLNERREFNEENLFINP